MEKQRNWNKIYGLLIIWLGLIIIMLYFFTRYFA